MTGVDALLTETALRVFRDQATFAAVERAEADGWAPTMWSAIAETGLPWVSVPASAGGAGGTLADAVEILRIAGRQALPLPIGETGMLGGWLLAGAGLELPDGPTTVVPALDAKKLVVDRGVVTGRVNHVPWARAVESIVVLLEVPEPTVVLVGAEDVEVQPRVNLAGEPRDTVIFDGVEPRATAPARDGVDARVVLLRGALARTASMAGALDRLAELTLEYTAERRQFGRAVAEFPAVQDHLVHVVQQRELVALALAAAVDAARSAAAAFEIPAAKLLANQAAGSATRHAHQAHGAMGMTREYPLHHLSRRLWSWRSEYGDSRFWSRRVGGLAVEAGADGFYELITGGATRDEVAE